MHDDGFTQAYGVIARRLLRGKVVPVLGAGVNLCERPPEALWQRGTYLPSAAELAAALVAEYPMIDSRDLAQVAQYIVSKDGAGPLYEELHDVFDADYPPTRLHRMLAQLARHLRLSAGSRECMLCVTTNYDDSLERAFAEIGEPYDVVTYIAEGPDRGKFRHTTPGGHSIVIDKPNEYVDVRLDERTVIAKVHGAVDRAAQQDSYVITEDHYIDYITRADVSGLFPVTLAAKLRTSHLLFLGYSLRDWNLRVMLYRLWGEQAGRNFKCWAIQSNPSPIDQAAWDDRGVDILPVRVESFVDAVREWMPHEEVEVA
jgi:SIR2-like protein